MTTTFRYAAGRLLPAEGPALEATDRGFTLGDGVFETLRTAGGWPFLLAAHLRRLAHGAAVLGLPLPASSELAGSVEGALTAAALPGEAIVRLSVSRGPTALRGLLPAGDGPPTIVLAVAPLAAPPPGGLVVVTSGVRRNEGSPLSRLKTLSYLDNVLARQEAAAAGAGEALMLNNRGEVACVSAGNLFWLDRRGRLCTPAPACGVLEGITRALVLDLARGEGRECVECAAPLGEVLAGTAEAFVTNSAIGVQAVASLDGTTLPGPVPGAVTRRLAALYEAEVAQAPRSPA